MQDHTQALREALQGFLDFHTKPAGISVELITEKELFSQAMADIGKREDALIEAARAALSSHHEDGGRAEQHQIKHTMTRNKDLLPLLSEVIDAEFHQLYPGADKGDKHLFREGARWAWANLPAGEPARAPWPDFMGQPIYHGDRLVHPQDGSEFVAVRLEHQEGETDAWRAVYDGDPTRTSRLCLQIGEKGQAVLSERAAVITPAAPVALGGEPPCNPRPDAPHGYNRNASHNAGRYVCDCEGWAAMGGDKGGAVAWRFRWHPEGDWHLTEKEPRGGDGTTKQPLFAAPVGKARMLTDEEADHITGMHNTGRSQGDSECAEAIQRKFCEVNGITLQGGA